MNGAEYDNYGKQYQTFQKIIAVYDTEPDNFPRYCKASLCIELSISPVEQP